MSDNQNKQRSPSDAELERETPHETADRGTVFVLRGWDAASSAS
jgi:hypothetical protein